MDKVSEQNLLKHVANGDIDIGVFSIAKYEMMSYAYGFTPKQIEEMDEVTFQWYAAFAKLRVQNGVKM